MRRGRAFSIQAALLLILVLAGGIFTQREGIAGWWRHWTVRKLLDPTQREAVYKRIVEWQRYRGTPRYTVDPLSSGEPIHDVVLCTQRGGRPFYAVVVKQPWSGAGHHFELVDFDGTFVPVFLGWNVGSCDFKDLNGDRVLDRLESRSYRLESGKNVQALTLIPMTPDQKLALRVVYRIHLASWAWTVVDTSGELPEIRLGPRDPASGEVTPRATYRWERSQSRYVGPGGGIDQNFFRVDEDSAKSEEFARHEG
jgi:hypothetical protein